MLDFENTQTERSMQDVCMDLMRSSKDKVKAFKIKKGTTIDLI